ncbi:MAG: hydroxymethylglutaryl-CoA reductase, degradative [Bacteroidetes bacterium]|nr:hydroxymethylglutaryl-CoA reductase, degradative [Bacteroidota bacterium]
MKKIQPVKGFSKLSKQAKIEWLINNYSLQPDKALDTIQGYLHQDVSVQKLHDEFIENTISNFYLPFGIAPNFLINGQLYAIPMAIEESSVVAAASKAANFWLERRGFKTTILSTRKVGHVHFIWHGQNHETLFHFFENIQSKFYENSQAITRNMESRGGGIADLKLRDKTHLEPGYYQLEAQFETCDSMGANFINSCLESFAHTLQEEMATSALLEGDDRQLQIVMSILSNYTPECLVRVEVSCPVEEINEGSGIGNQEFAEKFCRAIRIAEIEPYRAVTHNKGIMNGIDSVVLATGNDFRAVEACIHAYAARNGSYRSLTHAEIVDDLFVFSMEIPLSLGTVGGITSLHPMVKFAHEILGHPNAQGLMQIVAAAGLAQNFSAVRSLITSGIQKGHMKMHLLNILNQLEATDEEKLKIVDYFKDHVVSFSETVKVFCEIRGISQEVFAARKGH